MSEIKISEMPIAESVGEEDLIPIVQNGANKVAKAKDIGIDGKVVEGSRLIDTEDDLSGKTLYFDFNDITFFSFNEYETTIIKTDDSNKITSGWSSSGKSGLIKLYDNGTETILYEITEGEDEPRVNLAEYTLSNSFGTVTEINSNAFTYNLINIEVIAYGVTKNKELIEVYSREKADAKLKTLTEKIVGTVLYEDGEGTNENLILNDSKDNYDDIEIQGYLKTSTKKIGFSSGKMSANLTEFNVSMNRCVSEDSVQFCQELLTIEGVACTRTYGNFVTFNGLTPSNSDQHKFHITKIIGYKY